MKKRIIFSTGFSAVCFAVSYAVICPYIKVMGDDGVVSVLHISLKRYMLTAAITALSFLFFFFADKYFEIASRIHNFLSKNIKRILLFSAGSACVILASALVEVLFRNLHGADSAGKYFNAASFGTVASIGMLIFIFAFERKNIASRPEKAVALIILISGALIIFTEPFSHNSSDEDSHYYWAVQNSFVKQAHLTQADYCVSKTIDFSIADGHNVLSSNEKIDNMNQRGEYATYTVNVDNSIPHKPAGILIAVSRLFGANFRTRFICGQFGMLITYAALAYFAIKKLKSGKMIMSIIALFPTNLVLASNFSYDPWITGFTMLGTSYFVSELQQPEKRITVFETVVMCGAFVLAALPKQLYVMFLILPMFMRKNRQSKSDKRRYYLILSAFFVFMLVLFAIRAFSSVTSGGDTRGGDVNSMGQVNYILTNPIKYSKTLIKFLLGYLSPLNAKKYMSYFSYLGDGGSAAVFMSLLLFCMITDKDITNKFNGRILTAAVVLAVDFALVCMTATALYISFTPVGYETINGCPGRYLLPLTVPFALTLINPGKPLRVKKSIYNFAVLAVMSACVLFKILYVVTWPML